MSFVIRAYDDYISVVINRRILDIEISDIMSYRILAARYSHAD